MIIIDRTSNIVSRLILIELNKLNEVKLKLTFHRIILIKNANKAI